MRVRLSHFVWRFQWITAAAVIRARIKRIKYEWECSGQRQPAMHLARPANIHMRHSSRPRHRVLSFLKYLNKNAVQMQSAFRFKYHLMSEWTTMATATAATIVPCVYIFVNVIVGAVTALFLPLDFLEHNWKTCTHKHTQSNARN